MMNMFLKPIVPFLPPLTHNKASSPFYFCHNRIFGQLFDVEIIKMASGKHYSDLPCAKPKINWLSVYVTGVIRYM